MDYQAWTVEAGMAYVTMATLVPALHVWWRAPHYRRRCDSYANKVWKIYAESNLNGCVLVKSLPGATLCDNTLCTAIAGCTTPKN